MSARLALVPKALAKTPLSERWVEVPQSARNASEDLRALAGRIASDLGRATTPQGLEAALKRLRQAQQLARRAEAILTRGQS